MLASTTKEELLATRKLSMQAIVEVGREGNEGRADTASVSPAMEERAKTAAEEAVDVSQQTIRLPGRGGCSHVSGCDEASLAALVSKVRHAATHIAEILSEVVPMSTRTASVTFMACHPC
mmetsp:Transcript_29382/g.55030  ORF Transcript_29382/g.55030 Transcript_29382/m.55030 type:complete len:120 (+) Transcript_29382:136-495(+)